MASVAALSAATQDRKARLAQLKSLKRKQAPTSNDDPDESSTAANDNGLQSAEDAADDTSRYISGRNYDSETRGPRLGFETAPSEGQETLEEKAAQLAEETKRQAEADALTDKPLDLFKLQPKKPNWDLKRDLDGKMDLLNVRTDNAIARLVKERIGKQQQAAKEKMVSGNGDAEAAGIEGSTLVEATNIREREDKAEARRELEEDEALLLDAS